MYCCKKRFCTVFVLFLSQAFTVFGYKAQGVEFSTQKEQLVHLYEAKKYAKAERLIEQIAPLAKYHQDRLELHYYRAYCRFYQQNYTSSAQCFRSFVKKYPYASQREEAVYMSGYSLSCRDIDIHLDQDITYDALSSLESYLAAYPGGRYVQQTKEAIDQLRVRLMKKELATVELYMKLRLWSSAATMLHHFEQSYPSSCYQFKVLNLLVCCYAKLLSRMGDKKVPLSLIQQSEKERLEHLVEQFKYQLKMHT